MFDMYVDIKDEEAVSEEDSKDGSDGDCCSSEECEMDPDEGAATEPAVVLLCPWCSFSCRSPVVEGSNMGHLARHHKEKALAATKLDVNEFRTDARYSAVMVLMSQKVKCEGARVSSLGDRAKPGAAL